MKLHPPPAVRTDTSNRAERLAQIEHIQERLHRLHLQPLHLTDNFPARLLSFKGHPRPAMEDR